MTRRSAIGLALALCLTAPNFAWVDSAAGQELLQVGGGTIRIDFATNLSLPHPVMLEWVRRAAVAVTNVLGRFPVKELSLNVEKGGRNGVGGGVTHGARLIEVRLGRRAKAEDLNHDWVLTHEMFHLAFPTLDDRYLWMMEGLSDYLEPVARGRAGQLTPQEVWREFVEGLPQGLPAEGDHGLDNTFTRERIYWGGNIYWLLADVRIREKTKNQHSVDDAIRAILGDGGNGDAAWSLERVLKVGDKATHTTVLTDLHNELGPKPGTVDLDALWKRLGVNYNKGDITFDNSAPDAGIRIAITSGANAGLGITKP
jgi:predicted metalloprotease with PDZ domain